MGLYYLEVSLILAIAAWLTVKKQEKENKDTEIEIIYKIAFGSLLIAPIIFLIIMLSH